MRTKSFEGSKFENKKFENKKFENKKLVKINVCLNSCLY